MPFSNIGLPELIIVFVIALLVLGPKRLPDVAKSLGNGIREFRESLGGGGGRRSLFDDDDDDEEILASDREVGRKAGI